MVRRTPNGFERLMVLLHKVFLLFYALTVLYCVILPPNVYVIVIKSIQIFQVFLSLIHILGTPKSSAILVIAIAAAISRLTLRWRNHHSLDTLLQRGCSCNWSIRSIKAVQKDSGYAVASMVTNQYSHILDDDRKADAVFIKESFYSSYDNCHPKNISFFLQCTKRTLSLDFNLSDNVLRLFNTISSVFITTHWFDICHSSNNSPSTSLAKL